MKKIVYYAHALYKTPQETRDIVFLESLGLEVLNPANFQGHFNNWLDKRSPKDNPMDYWYKKILRCDYLTFRAFPDGSIPAGVFKEIEEANAQGKPIFELPSAILRRKLNVAETREYLKEMGFR